MIQYVLEVLKGTNSSLIEFVSITCMCVLTNIHEIFYRSTEMLEFHKSNHSCTFYCTFIVDFLSLHFPKLINKIHGHKWFGHCDGILE